MTIGGRKVYLRGWALELPALFQISGPLRSCVTLSKLLSLSKPIFSHLQKGDHSAFIVARYKNELMTIKQLIKLSCCCVYLTIMNYI